jgi:hypothetical protein
MDNVTDFSHGTLIGEEVLVGFVKNPDALQG